MKKRFFSIIMTAVLVILFIPTMTAYATTQTWQTAYEEILRDYASRQDIIWEGRGWFLHDIDMDGVPELILRTGRGSTQSIIYTFRDGNAVRLNFEGALSGDFAAAIAPNDNNAGIISRWMGQDQAFTGPFYTRFVIQGDSLVVYATGNHPMGAFAGEWIIPHWGISEDNLREYLHGSHFAVADSSEPIPAPMQPASGAILHIQIGNPTITWGTNTQTLEAPPFIDEASERTMVPLVAFRHAGIAEVGFVDQIAYVFDLDGNEILALPIGVAVPNDTVAPVIVEGRTFVPLGFILNALELEFRWDSATSAVYIEIP